ncbi:hypothetical protein B7494_g1537 [Chlorociboria aeruginascens]|nr:hypothetical protein B7494_g1537 [Chlorociboria aeruginascens]
MVALAIAVDLPQAVATQGEEPRDVHAPEQASKERDAREDTELRLRRNSSGVSSNRPSRPRTAAKKPTKLLDRFVYAVSSFWRNQISVKVEHTASRDHLGVPSPDLSSFNRLQHAPTPSPTFGFYVLGKPLSCICQGTAIYILVIGAFRTWRSQNAIVRGKAITGGFEIVFLLTGVFLVVVTISHRSINPPIKKLSHAAVISGHEGAYKILFASLDIFYYCVTGREIQILLRVYVNGDDILDNLVLCMYPDLSQR